VGPGTLLGPEETGALVLCSSGRLGPGPFTCVVDGLGLLRAELFRPPYRIGFDRVFLVVSGGLVVVGVVVVRVLRTA
jgi:hypothetical protein